MLAVASVSLVSCDDPEPTPPSPPSPPGGVDGDVKLIAAFYANTEEPVGDVIDLGITGTASFVYVYNRAPAAAYLEVVEQNEDDAVYKTIVDGKMGGYSSKHGGYLVAYNVNLGYSAQDDKTFICAPFFKDSKGNVAAIGQNRTMTQKHVLAGIGKGNSIDRYSTVVVDSGETTEITIFTYAYCQDLTLTLSTKRVGVPEVKLTALSNEYNEELELYTAVFVIPALVYDDSETGAINRYTLTAAPMPSSTSTQSYRVQIRDPDPNIDDGGWRPV